MPDLTSRGRCAFLVRSMWLYVPPAEGTKGFFIKGWDLYNNFSVSFSAVHISCSLHRKLSSCTFLLKDSSLCGALLQGCTEKRTQTFPQRWRRPLTFCLSSALFSLYNFVSVTQIFTRWPRQAGRWCCWSEVLQVARPAWSQTAQLPQSRRAWSWTSRLRGWLWTHQELLHGNSIFMSNGFHKSPIYHRLIHT